MSDADLIEQLRDENDALRRENAELRRRLNETLKEIEEWRRGHRERGKRRSSRAEGSHRPSTGRPKGGQPGHPGSNRPVPERIDRTEDHPLPPRCPCGGEVEDTGETQSTVVQDIPPVQVENVRHVGHIGRCQRCGRRVVSELPGMSRLGDAATQVQLGPTVAARALELRFDHHLPVAGIGKLLRGWFGVPVSAGGLCALFARVGSWTAPAYEEVRAHVQGSAVVGLDETTLRQDGVGAWVWIARTDDASLFRVELSRGAWVADQLLGERFIGVVCSDFYGAYTRREDWQHAYCGAHNIREAKKIAEVDPTPLTLRFQLRLRQLYAAGVAAQQSEEPTAQASVIRRFKLLTHDQRFTEHPELARLQNRFEEHFDGIVHFVSHPGVPMTNNMTERDVRAVALHRKVTGGTRSDTGSNVFAHWMTVTQTLRKNGLGLRDWIDQVFTTKLQATAPPSVFARTRSRHYAARARRGDGFIGRSEGGVVPRSAASQA